MFAPRYFAPRYFAPRYFPPGEVVAEQVEEVVVGKGGGFDMWSGERLAPRRERKRKEYEEYLDEVYKQSVEQVEGGPKEDAATPIEVPEAREPSSEQPTLRADTQALSSTKIAPPSTIVLDRSMRAKLDTAQSASDIAAKKRNKLLKILLLMQ